MGQPHLNFAFKHLVGFEKKIPHHMHEEDCYRLKEIFLKEIMPMVSQATPMVK
jgi:hypothetical protein